MRLERHPRFEYHRRRPDEPETQRLIDNSRLTKSSLGVVVEILVDPSLGTNLDTVDLKEFQRLMAQMYKLRIVLFRCIFPYTSVTTANIFNTIL